MANTADVWIGDGADIVVYRKGEHPLLTVSEAIARYEELPAPESDAGPAEIMARIHHLNWLVDEMEFTLTNSRPNLEGRIVGDGVAWGEGWLCILHWLAAGEGPFPADAETLMIDLLVDIRGSVDYRYETVGGELRGLWDRLRLAELARRKAEREAVPLKQAA